MGADMDTTERYRTILKAYERVVGMYEHMYGPDEEPHISELLPGIFEAVPDTCDQEIIDALRWAGEAQLREAQTLKRYSAK
jgi:hypothetical protein